MHLPEPLSTIFATGCKNEVFIPTAVSWNYVKRGRWLPARCFQTGRNYWPAAHALRFVTWLAVSGNSARIHVGKAGKRSARIDLWTCWRTGVLR